jgi:hypothetical protein
VSNTSTIIPGEVVSKILCSEVDEEIVVPRDIRWDEKEMFVGEIGIDGSTGSITRKCCDEFSQDEGFLALGCYKFDVVLLKDDDLSGKFSINFSVTEKVLHWVGICYDLGSSKQDVMVRFLDYEDNCKGEFLFVIIFQGWP